MANETSTVNFVFTSTDKTTNVLGGVAKGFAALGVAAVAATGAAVVGLGAFAASGIKAAASMEEQMSNIAAVMGMTSDEIAPLNNLIKELGLDPNLKVDATEAASAIELLARNGLSMAEILDGAARSTVLLANATGAEFGDAADIATDAMSIFNIEAEDMMTAVDGIVSVTTNSKLSINDYALAMANGAARATAAGVSFEDFNTTIALIADEAGNGQKAGTALGAMMTRLVPQTDKAAEAMQELGIITESGQNRFYDASGAFLGMGNAADVLNETLGGLTEQQQLSAISTLFGVDASAAALGIMNETSETFAAAQAQMGDTSAVDSAATRMDNLSGQWEIFMGIVDTVKLQIGEAFLPVLKSLVTSLSGLAEEHSPAVVEAFSRIGEWLGEVLPPLLEALPGFIENVVNAFFSFRDWFNEVKPIVVDFIDNALNKINEWWESTGSPIVQAMIDKFNVFKDWVVETAPIVISFVKDALERVQTWFDDNKPKINDFVENVLKPFWAMIVETATSIKDFVLVQFEKITAWYKENEPLIQEFAAIVATAWGIMMVALVTFWDVVGPILNTLIDFILEVATLIMAVATGDWETAWQSMKDIVALSFTGIQDLFLGLADWVTGFLGTTWEDTVQVWRDNVAQFFNIGSLIISKIIDGIEDRIIALRDAIKDAAIRMKDGWELGMARIRNGIIDAALAPFRGAIDAVKRLLGIASPSKLFEEFGANTGEGFAIGLTGQSANVAAAGAQMGRAAIGGATSTTTNYNLNVATTADTSNVIQDFQMMQAWAG
jgi:TP901 family phage tail tape measure protein